MIAAMSLVVFLEYLAGCSCVMVTCAFPHHLYLGHRVAAAGSGGSVVRGQSLASGMGLSFES